MSKNRKCAHCKRRRAVYIIRDCFANSANGKPVCRESVCFMLLTRGYPAEGAVINV